MRKTIVVAFVALVIAGCGAAPRTAPTSGDDILFVAAGSAVSAIDARTHTTVTQLPLGVPSADWKHYYFATSGILQDYDPMTSLVRRTLPLPGDYTLPLVTANGRPGGISQNGQYLVLQATNDGTSHLVVVDTSFTKTPSRVDIPGDFTFDAISNDGLRIYLIQHTSNDHYFVRDYVLGSGLDSTIIFDKTDGAVAMSGLRLMGVPSPDGSMLYSVYARKNQSAFIHQLSLEGPIAFCIDLSGPGYAADNRAMRWSLAMTGDGGRLFATNAALGVITEIWLDSNVQRTLSIDGGTMPAFAGALLTFDGRRLIVAGDGVRWMDAATLQTTARALDSWKVTGIDAAPDGKSVFALSDSGKVAQLDPQGKVIDTFDTGSSGLTALLSVQRFG